MFCSVQYNAIQLLARPTINSRSKPLFVTGKSCQLHCMKHCCSACCGDSRLRRSLITKSTFENSRSLGTDLCITPKSIRTTGTNDGYLLRCCMGVVWFCPMGAEVWTIGRAQPRTAKGRDGGRCRRGSPSPAKGVRG